MIAPAAELRAPDPARTPLAALGETLFFRMSPYEGEGFRNHCQRLFHFTKMLLDRERLRFDDGLAYAIAMVHDLGLFSERDQGENYLQRSRALFHRETRGIELPNVDTVVIDECLTLNHRIFPVPNMSAEAECFRRAVWIEHTRGLKRYGLERDRISAVFACYPRADFDRVLVDFTRRVLLHEPRTLIDGIFL